MLPATTIFAQPAPATPAAAPAAPTGPATYKVVNKAQFMGTGGLDYVFADSANRRLYVPRGTEVGIYDLDTLKAVGNISNARAHGAVVDPENKTGICSGDPAVMWNIETLAQIKTIPAPGADGILFDAATHHFFILSHRAPNLLVIDSKDGSIVGTVDKLGKDDTNGAIEQGASDGQGHLYFDVEDQGCIAVVDAKTLKVTGHYDLGPSGGGAAGLALDNKNHILFAMCRGSAGSGGPTCVILSATDGKIITTLPLAGSSDGAVFNPATMEAFSSHGNGTLSIIKENSPTSFALEPTVTTQQGAKTCTLDAKTGHVIVITTEAAPAATPPATTAAATPAPAAAAAPATTSAGAPASVAAAPGAGAPPAGARAGGGRRGGGGNNGPSFLDVIVVGKAS